MNNIFVTRSFWLELNVPYSIVKAKFKEYFGENEYSIKSRLDAIALLSPIIESIKDKMIFRVKSQNINVTINKLYRILDDCFRFYIHQKDMRYEMSGLNINDASLDNTFVQNRNISLNVIDAVNLWIENCVLYQTDLTKEYDNKEYNIDFDLFLDMYIYGFTSQTRSLLEMSKKFGDKEMFYGISVNSNKDVPAEIIKYHPIIYFNTLLTGNQDIINTTYENENIKQSEFCKGFFEEYNINFINSLRMMSSIQADTLNDGKIALAVIDKDIFISEVRHLSNNSVDGEIFFNIFVLTNKNLRDQVRKNDSIIWVMNSNKFRHELRPFICLDNNRIYISYCAIEQAKQLWISIFNNGGMSYSNCKDKLTIAIEKRNEELSIKLVNVLREKLRKHYSPNFDDIDVKYDRIFGSRDINYGDFDLIFYTQDTNELFLIEAKFFSDSLNNSGIISDYEKLYKTNGYYDRCRRRYDLVLREPQKMKNFIGVKKSIKIHFLFVSSKPLEIEFQDKDGIVSFPCLSIFDKYLEGKLNVDKNGKRVMRPNHII